MHYSNKDNSVVFDVVWAWGWVVEWRVYATFLHACLCIIIPCI